MVAKLKNIIENVIDMKCNEVIGLNFEDMEESEKEEHTEVHKQVLALENKLKETLTADQWKLFMELDTEVAHLEALEQDYLFKRGVKMGLNELRFIKYELGLMVIEL